MPDITYVLILLLIPVLSFLATALWLWNNAEHVRFRWKWRENKRRIPRNFFLSALITQPDPSRVWGVDVSRWDGNVDFTVTRQRGASFAIVKATEGTVNIAYWSENIARARAAGLVVGSYHWLHRNSSVSCKAQALAAWNRLSAISGQRLPLFVDFETTLYAGSLASPNFVDLDLFVTEYTRLSGEKPILYSSPGYMAQFGRMSDSLRAKFAGLWIANYGVSAPNLPTGFTNYLFWQFSAEGDAKILTPNDAGKLEVDLNYFQGTVSELEELAGGAVVPPPPPTGGTMERWMVIWDAGANKRPQPNVNNTAVGVIPDNTEFDVLAHFIPTGKTAAQEDWGRLTDGTWVALTYNWQVRAVLVSAPPPSEPQAPSRVVVTMNGVSWEATTFTKL